MTPPSTIEFLISEYDGEYPEPEPWAVCIRNQDTDETEAWTDDQFATASAAVGFVERWCLDRGYKFLILTATAVRKP